MIVFFVFFSERDLTVSCSERSRNIVYFNNDVVNTSIKINHKNTIHLCELIICLGFKFFL